MKHPLIDKILTEWAYRVPNGMPDPKDPYHIVMLEESLNELRMPRKVIEKVLNKVRKYADNKMNQDLGRVGEPWGSDAEDVSDRGVSDDDVESFDDDELASITHDALSTPEPMESRMEASADHIEDHKSDAQKENDRRHDEAVEKKKEKEGIKDFR